MDSAGEFRCFKGKDEGSLVEYRCSAECGDLFSYGVVVLYAVTVFGVMGIEFAFVGINLQRTFNCQGGLI